MVEHDVLSFADFPVPRAVLDDVCASDSQSSPLPTPVSFFSRSLFLRSLHPGEWCPV